MFNIGFADEQHDGCCGKGNNARFDVQCAVDYEGQCNQSDHDNALLEQRLALDCLMGVQLHDRSLLFGGYAHLLAVHNVEHQQRNKQDDEHGRAVDCQEVKEREACGGADHDVRRVADERCGATNVRRNDFRQEERNGVDLQHLANGVGNGADKQNGGDVVQECGKNSGD